MKKFSAVLLILALVGGALFAGFTGSASVSLGLDLDKKSYGFANATEVNAELNFLELLVDKAGEGDIYAEIKAELSLGINFAEQASGFNPFAAYSVASTPELVLAQGKLAAFEADPANRLGDDDAEGNPTFDYSKLAEADQKAYDALVKEVAKHTSGAVSGLTGVAKITSAKIIGDNWYVGILGAMAAPNFAASAIDLDDDGDALLDLEFGKPGAGVEVGFADYKFGLSVAGNYGTGAYNFFLSAVTPEYEFADGLTAQFGAAGLLTDTVMGGFASVAVGYELDELDVSLATDLEFGKGLFDVEVAVAATYDFLNADIYYALKDSGAVYTGADHVVSVGLGADIAGFDIAVAGKDLVHTQDLSASVGYAVTDELSVGVEGGFVIATKAWSAGGNATYTADMFTAKVAGSYNSAEQLKLSASVSSDKLIDGATLSLGYAGEDLLKKGIATAKSQVGAITAKAAITF